MISPDANIITTYDGAAKRAGIDARVKMVGETLDLVDRWNQGTETVSTQDGDPAVISLVGKAGMGSVSLVGHSRGGEAVTNFVAANNARNKPLSIRGVVAIAPTDLTGEDPFRDGATNLAEILPACDGDDSNLDGSRIFERVKKSNAAKYQWLVEGANHNWFNSTWTNDDSRDLLPTLFDSRCRWGKPSNVRLTAKEQRLVGARLVVGFVRRYGGGEQQFGPALRTGSLESSACPHQSKLPCSGRIRSTYIAPPNDRRLLVGPGGTRPLAVNAVGGRIVSHGLQLSVCDPRLTDRHKQRAKCPGPESDQIHRIINRSWTKQLIVSWNRRSSLEITFPPGKVDASSFTQLTFRGAPIPSEMGEKPGRCFSGKRGSIHAALTDIDGRVSSVAIRAPKALRHSYGSHVQQALLSDVSVSLSRFTKIDTAKLASVQLRFPNPSRKSCSIGIADIALQR